jgi:hypothetical protein
MSENYSLKYDLKFSVCGWHSAIKVTCNLLYKKGRDDVPIKNSVKYRSRLISVGEMMLFFLIICFSTNTLEIVLGQAA